MLRNYHLFQLPAILVSWVLLYYKKYTAFLINRLPRTRIKYWFRKNSNLVVAKTSRVAACKGQLSQDKDPWTGQSKSSSKWYGSTPFIKKLKDLIDRYGTQHPLLPKKKKNQDIRYLGLNIIFNLVLCWGIWGFYLVKPEEQVVTTRLGRYYQTTGSGLHWHIRFIDHLFRVNREFKQYYTTTSFTQDNKLVQVFVTIRYHIQDARCYLFCAKKLGNYLQQVMLSALDQTINRTTFLDLLDSKTPDIIKQALYRQLQELTTRYPMGFSIEHITLPSVQVPESVKSALESTQKTESQAQHLRHQAEVEAIQIERTARKEVSKLLAEVRRKQYQTLSRTRADIDRFLMLLPFYERAPQLTLQRLTVETLEAILKKNSAVLLLPSASHITDALPNIQLKSEVG